jgi:hypothetical protein
MQGHDDADGGEDLQPGRCRPVRWSADVGVTASFELLGLTPAKPVSYVSGLNTTP